EDRGFRLAEIRNLGIAASAGRYLVFMDGDCITRPSFVAAHRRLAEPGWFVTGNRILMSQRLTAQALAMGGAVRPELLGFAAYLSLRARGDLNRLAPLFALPLGSLRKRRATQWQGANGSNMAFWRGDLEAVDGFDAAFTGWGREDSDIFVRLIRSGVRRKDGRFATGVLHLWHREAARSGLDGNERRLAEIIGGNSVKARRGLSWRDEAEKSDAVAGGAGR